MAKDRPAIYQELVVQRVDIKHFMNRPNEIEITLFDTFGEKIGNIFIETDEREKIVVEELT